MSLFAQAVVTLLHWNGWPCYQSMWRSYHSPHHIYKHSPVHCGEFLRSFNIGPYLCRCVRQEATGKAALLWWETRQARTHPGPLDTETYWEHISCSGFSDQNKLQVNIMIILEKKYYDKFLVRRLFFIMGRVYLNRQTNKKCPYMGGLLHVNRGEIKIITNE